MASSIDRDELRQALMDSPLCQAVSDDADVDEMFQTYETVLCDIANRIAPRHNIRRRAGRLAPWFDDNCRQVRRESRRLDRRYRRSRSAHDRRRWIDAVRQRFRLYRLTKEAYRIKRLLQEGHSQPLLWRSLSNMLGRDRDTTSDSHHTADGFAAFFCPQGRGRARLNVKSSDASGTCTGLYMQNVVV